MTREGKWELGEMTEMEGSGKSRSDSYIICLKEGHRDFATWKEGGYKGSFSLDSLWMRQLWKEGQYRNLVCSRRR